MLDKNAKSSGKQAFHLPASFKQIFIEHAGAIDVLHMSFKGSEW